MLCPRCGFDNQQEAKFCEKCGERLESVEAGKEDLSNTVHLEDCDKTVHLARHSLSRVAHPTRKRRWPLVRATTTGMTILIKRMRLTGDSRKGRKILEVIVRSTVSSAVLF